MQLLPAPISPTKTTVLSSFCLSADGISGAWPPSFSSGGESPSGRCAGMPPPIDCPPTAPRPDPIINRRAAGKITAPGGSCRRSGPVAWRHGVLDGMGVMRKLLLLLVVLVVLGLIGGVVALAVWEPPVPTQPMEKTVPNDRLKT